MVALLRDLFFCLYVVDFFGESPSPYTLERSDEISA